MEGHVCELVVRCETDLQREVFHHQLTSIEIVELGLTFESERTAGLEMPLSSLLGLAVQDIRDNARQMHTESADRADTQTGLANFFEGVERLSTEFPWSIKLTCPMSLARIEEIEDGDVSVIKYAIPDDEVERVSAAFAEIAFDQADADSAEE